MSKKYETPDMEIVRLEIMDVITTSAGGEDVGYVDELPWLDPNGDF